MCPCKLYPWVVSSCVFWVWFLHSSEEKYCRIWELQQEWEAEGTLPSQPTSSFQSPFDVSPKSQKFPGSPLFWFLAADKLRMCFGCFSWVIQSSNVSPCYPLSKVSCFQPSPPWSNWGGKKNLAGGMNAGNHGSRKGIIYTNACCFVHSSVLTAWATNCRPLAAHSRLWLEEGTTTFALCMSSSFYAWDHHGRQF